MVTMDTLKELTVHPKWEGIVVATGDSQPLRFYAGDDETLNGRNGIKKELVGQVFLFIHRKPSPLPSTRPRHGT